MASLVYPEAWLTETLIIAYCNKIGTHALAIMKKTFLNGSVISNTDNVELKQYYNGL